MNRRVTIGVGLLVGGFLTVPASARVDLTGGRRAVLRNPAASSRHMARVRFTREAGIAAPLSDPGLGSSWVRLRSDTGDTGLIQLAPGIWAAWRKDGYKCIDHAGTRGGVRVVRIRPGKKGGRLTIYAAGDAYAAVGLVGPLAWLEAEIYAGGVRYCGRFEPPTSTLKKNTAQRVTFR